MKQIITLVLVAFTTIASAQNCGELFISEYIEGSSNNKALEIYNPTANAVNMSGYSVKAYNNGGTSVSNSIDLPNKMLAAGDVYVIANGSAVATILGVADTTSTVTFYNGDDAIVLFKNTDTLDIIGVVGFDPGTNWPVGTGATSEFTLVRKATVQGGQKDWAIGATEWDVYPQNTDSDLGMHTSSCITVPGAPCSDLFISEYIEGSSNNKALEIYNPSLAAIDMTGYTIYMFGNGSPTSTASFALSGMLASGATYVLAANAANASILALADTALAFPSVTHFNGDDALLLVSPSDTIDAIGIRGIDPGTNWVVGSGATSEYTLVRKVTVAKGTTDWAVGATQWDVYPQNTDTYLGSHASTCLGAVVPDPIYPIAAVTSVDVDGVVDSLNVTCLIQGYVSGNNLRTNGASGVEFWLIDTINSAGVLVRNTSYAFYNVTEGDKILVHGIVNQFNGLVQFVPDSITVKSSGNTLPAAAPVTTLDEASEGRLVVMNNMTIVSGWPAPGSSSNVIISDGTNTFTLRADSDVYLGDSLATAPTGLVNVYGHGGQFDNSSPYTTGYQINPRYIADIEPVVALTPTINFPSPAQTATEGAGTLNIVLPINPTSASAETVKIYVVEGTGITSGDYTTTPAAVNDTITLSVAAGDSAMFDITLIDDVIQENSETLTFSIASVTSGLTVGATSSHVLTIADNDVFIPTYSISDLKGLDMNFAPDSNGVMCKVVGTVLGVDMQGIGSANVSFTIHNGTDGFGVFRANSAYTVTEGDQVRVIGTVGQFNGLAQINADSITFISANNTLPTPVVFTDLNESIESQLGRFNNAYIIDPTQWTNSGSGFNVDITNGTDTIAMRVDKDVVDVFNAPAPTGTFDLIGIGGQFDNTAPYNSGYQFLPRYLADFIVPLPQTYDLAITEIMASSNDPDATVNEDWWELTNYGNTTVNLDGFSWDDDSEVPGTVVFPSINIAAGESFVIWRGISADETAFLANWGLTSAAVTVLSSDEFTGGFPGLGSGGDAVVLYDSSATAIEICKATYLAATAGFSIEFDTLCSLQGNAVNGINGAYTSNGGDVGSPGNKPGFFSVEELSLENVNVYPNPVQNTLIVDMPVGEKTLSLVTITGVIVIQIEGNETQQRIDMSHLANGIYFVKITSNGQTLVKKVVKQ